MILMHYLLNKDFIAKNLCEQRNVKNNTCEGSCHVKKQLKKQEEKQQSPLFPNEIKELKEINECIQNIFYFVLYPNTMFFHVPLKFEGNPMAMAFDVNAPPPDFK